MSHKQTDGDNHENGGCCGGHGHGHKHDHEEGGCCGGHGHGHHHHEEEGCCGGHGHAHDHDHEEGGCCGGHGAAHQPPGLENAGVLDAFAHDKSRDVLVMAMYETRPWNGGDLQLVQLQEKLNAYLSFALDGELAETFPQLAGKPVEIQLRTTSEPGPQVWDLIRRVREQLAFQDIAFEVIALEEETGGGCGCGH